MSSFLHENLKHSLRRAVPLVLNRLEHFWAPIAKVPFEPRSRAPLGHPCDLPGRGLGFRRPHSHNPGEACDSRSADSETKADWVSSNTSPPKNIPANPGFSGLRVLGVSTRNSYKPGGVPGSGDSTLARVWHVSSHSKTHTLSNSKFTDRHPLHTSPFPITTSQALHCEHRAIFRIQPCPRANSRHHVTPADQRHKRRLHFRA